MEVINNILRNAIEAIDCGGEIDIRIRRTGRHVILEISDNGCGIPSQNLSHVVTPYFSTKKNALNYGLGLSYCRDVMHKHGGLLEIQSIEAKGTKVFLKFPAKSCRSNSKPKSTN